MGKTHFFFALILLFFIPGCISPPKAELSAGDSDVMVSVLSNEERTLNITLRVHNIGELEAKNVVVIAEANPINVTGGSILIGSSNISSIPPKSEAEVSIKWDTKKTYRDNMIKLIIDPVNSIDEHDKTNNVVVFSYSIN